MKGETGVGKLEQIIATGNRGHQPRGESRITCADGTVLYVIAGGGTYCRPRVAYCTCGIAAAIPGSEAIFRPASYEDEEHDYPGPYTHVEVMLFEGELPDGWFEGDSVDTIAVDDVRAFIAAHGGEVE